MRPLRRSHHAVRVEMTPLIDVIFLLLTFFIYSLVMTVEAQILPVRLTTITSDSPQAAGPESASPRNIDAITLTRDGLFHFNQQPLAQQELPARLAAYAAQANRPRLFIAVEAQGDLDRGPLLIHLLEQLHRAGIDDFAIVGQSPTPPNPPTPPTTRPAASPSEAAP